MHTQSFPSFAVLSGCPCELLIMIRNIIELLKLGRIEFGGFSVGVMFSGALSLRPSAMNSADILALFALSIFATLWGFAHNDWCDVTLDRRSPALLGRPLVCGSVSEPTALSLIVCCILASFCIIALSHSGLGAFVLLASVTLGWLYNELSKKLPGSDMFFAASSALLCLLGALWIAGRSQPSRQTWNLVWTVVVIHFIDQIVFNTGAALKDIKNDLGSGVVNMAVVSGVDVGSNDELTISHKFQAYLILLKLLSLSFLFASPLLTGTPFTSQQALLLVTTAAASLWLTLQALDMKVFDRDQIGRRWLKQEAVSKLLVPILLLQTVGWQWCLFLILVPLGWFLAWNAVLYGRAASLNKGF